MKKVWDRVFDVRRCPLHFWYNRHVPRNLGGSCPHQTDYCCVNCPQKCERPNCFDLRDDDEECGSREANYLMEEMEEANKITENYADFLKAMIVEKDEKKG